MRCVWYWVARVDVSCADFLTIERIVSADEKRIVDGWTVEMQRDYYLNHLMSVKRDLERYSERLTDAYEAIAAALVGTRFTAARRAALTEAYKKRGVR